MPYAPGDPVCACFRVVNDITVGQTSTLERLHRDVVNTVGEWNIGDTFKIKDATHPFFGYESSTLTSDVIVQDAGGNMISCTTAGQGTNEITVTLTASAPAGDTLTICYRIGFEATYGSLKLDRKDERLDCHNITLNSTPTYQDVFNKPHPRASGTVVLKASMVSDGLTIQTNPAT